MPPVPSPENAALLTSFTRALRAENKAPRTIQSYEEAALLLGEHAAGRPFDEMTREDVDAFIGDQLARHKPSAAAVRYRGIRRFFNWLVDEEIIEKSPMAKMKQPHVPEHPVPVLDPAELKRLLDVTAGKDFVQRRDHAMLRLFLDCGVRLGEMAGVMLSDVDLKDHDVLHITGKGRKQRAAPFGRKSGTALDRYLRTRARHPRRDLPNLWIGSRGAMTESGIAQMMRRRADQAGVVHLHPHKFRHTSSHEFRVNGGDEDSLMRLMGWSSREMLHRYGASAADQRAREAHRAYAPGDRY